MRWMFHWCKFDFVRFTSLGGIRCEYSIEVVMVRCLSLVEAKLRGGWVEERGAGFAGMGCVVAAAT